MVHLFCPACAVQAERSLQSEQKSSGILQDELGRFPWTGRLALCRFPITEAMIWANAVY
jgi:hypothetical protein